MTKKSVDRREFTKAVAAGAIGVAAGAALPKRSCGQGCCQKREDRKCWCRIERLPPLTPEEELLETARFLWIRCGKKPNKTTTVWEDPKQERFLGDCDFPDKDGCRPLEEFEAWKKLEVEGETIRIAPGVDEAKVRAYYRNRSVKGAEGLNPR